MDIKDLDNHKKDSFEEINKRIETAKYNAMRAVNSELLDLYWHIGEMLSQKVSTENWGNSVIEELSEFIRSKNLGIKGFSFSNLWRMKKFYEEYKENEKLALLTREIGWTHNYTIFEKIKDNKAREYYLKATKSYGWTVAVLTLKIEQQDYERVMASQSNFELTVPEETKDLALMSIKDDYALNILNLSEQRLERQIEDALVQNIEEFLGAMNNMFTFVGRQFRLEVEGEEYFIDILLYHRVLKRLFAWEIKAGKFKPEYVGKMQFYLSALDDNVKLPEENPSIGVIVCREKGRTTVEYALRKITDNSIAVATFSEGEKLPDEYSDYLPTAKEISRRLESLQS